MNKVHDKVFKLTLHEIYNLEPEEYNELYEKYKNVNTLKTYGSRGPGGLRRTIQLCYS